MSSTNKPPTPPPHDAVTVTANDLHTLTTEHRRELAAFGAMESDLEIAFRLQLQEAIDASLSLQPSTSSSAPPRPPTPSNDAVLHSAELQALELDQFEQHLKDLDLSQSETRQMRDDFARLIHDRRVAREIQAMADDNWEECGDNFERPYGEGSSRSVSHELFRVYFKGLISEESVAAGGCSDRTATFGGIGVAICDSRNELVFELKKAVKGQGMSRRGVEGKALIEGLNAAIALDLKRVVFYCDYYPLYQFLTGRWPPRQQKVATLVDQVALLRKKFAYCRPSLVTRNDIKFAFKLAKQAIVSQISKPAELSRAKKETCVICLEDADVGHIFSIDGCMHRYCITCMKQHVEVKLLHGILPKCPHEGCDIELTIESCKNLLTPKLTDIMSQLKKEASIPVTEKIYCPYPKCSALMSKSQVLEYSKKEFATLDRVGARKCLNCHGTFCISCKVPWHTGITCLEYKRRNPNPHAEDAKLKTLAARNLWRQCVKCNHMIELAEGCYHMTCRCGFEFCYTCGAEWKNAKATCACPLWDEENILYDEDEDEDSFEDEDEFYEEDFEESFRLQPTPHPHSLLVRLFLLLLAPNMEIDADLRALLAEQRRELTAAKTAESDLGFAFQLQLQEAIQASLASTSSSSPPRVPLENDAAPPVPGLAHLLDEEIAGFERSARDSEEVQSEARRVRDDLNRRIHDQAFARHLVNIPEGQWRKKGDYIERPYVEGLTVHAASFRLYFKGMVSVQVVEGVERTLAGVGAAISDVGDNLVFEVKKPLLGLGRNPTVMAVELNALIEGLNAAIALGIERVTVFFDDNLLYQYVTGKWLPPRDSIAVTLVDRAIRLQRKFLHCNLSFVAREDVKFAFKFAVDAIASQVTLPAVSNRGKILVEKCGICLEDIDVGKMFSVYGCLHRYCFSCMKQHVEVKLLQGKLPECPYVGCKCQIKIESCNIFLTPNLFEIMSQSIKEASIPARERIYCPYPRCSAVISKVKVQGGFDLIPFPGAEPSRARLCTNCYGLFCLNCMVPWHEDMYCRDYKRLNPYPSAGDAKLESLARKNRWRQCVKCNHMVELARGCYHIYCRCGYEFCYTCGAEWKNKKATCACPIWDERNIVYDDRNRRQQRA
ncbi:hypothetical protein RJ639_012432 [Escallonia herrerae]|uniref:RBR-type E3 ubiquitin transferase n=1 Tax=Escallonia herrerae TaxID=1293975 RepID=A0AA88VMA7_9ASTE|nr:hypothetical protein RJ639_012432 [Escallonia herrerae]